QRDLLIKGKKYEDTSFVRDSADGYTVTGSTVKIIDTVGAHGWRVVGISYTDEINAAVKSSLAIVIPVSVLICVISAAVYLCVYDRLVTRPVRRLIKAMGEFESNAESYEYDASAPNIRELEAVSRSFGHTVSMIKELITEIRESEKERRKSEFRALQAQIDPHFLYNTLDSIQWMCEAGNTKDAAKMVAALAKLFRISLSRGRELITVGEEITHAKSYMVIQSFRYGDRFECEFNVDESLSGYSCCKVIIQPMLENAIYHGIGQIADDGRITVTVRKDGDFIAIDVADNGVGMTKEQCEAALSGTLGGGTGFGVRNVDQRLKLAFGNESCVTIKSVPDEGTTVTLKFSAVLPEEKA
ncbi:MAG: sensor histidine kinase, partial [Acutalibacteraceae bacterium]